MKKYYIAVFLGNIAVVMSNITEVHSEVQQGGLASHVSELV